MKEVSLFATDIYVKYWFQFKSSIAALKNLNLLCMLSTYQNKDVAKAATTALSCHLWYLSELLVRFAFFDDYVSVQTHSNALTENSRYFEPLKL